MSWNYCGGKERGGQTRNSRINPAHEHEARQLPDERDVSQDKGERKSRHDQYGSVGIRLQNRQDTNKITSKITREETLRFTDRSCDDSSPPLENDAAADPDEALAPFPAPPCCNAYILFATTALQVPFK